MSEEIRIIVVDDHDTFRDPLAFMLERESDLTVVARPRSLSEAREVLEGAEFAVDVAIVDLNLPDGSGADFISELQSSRPRAMALVLSATTDQEDLARAIEAGAAGVMHKSAPMSDLVEAVRGLAAGEQLLSQEEVIEALRFLVRVREIHREAQRAIDTLTRESAKCFRPSRRAGATRRSPVDFTWAQEQSTPTSQASSPSSGCLRDCKRSSSPCATA